MGLELEKEHNAKIPMMKYIFSQAEEIFLHLRQELCAEISQMEYSGKKFSHDEWKSPLGQGTTSILQDGELWEKAGVAFSSISSDKLPPAASSRNPHLAGSPFQACGISIVIHPRNPYVPTSHANLRIFVIKADKQGNSGDVNKQDKFNKNWWFGGGFDLTPYYVDENAFAFWHKSAETVCKRFDPALYGEFSKNCDKYFYLPHRGEARGIGGLFFDDFNPWDEKKCLSFVREVGLSYKEAYLKIANRLCQREYGAEERDFQLYRRGRYVEFNLLYDRGTLFGLQSGGRSESILMSLPPKVKWKYNASFPPGSEEAKLEQLLRKQDR